MRTHRKRRVCLVVEQLEERYTPAYLDYWEQLQLVGANNNTGVVDGFRLQAERRTFSETYFTPDMNLGVVEQWVNSSPTTFQQIQEPTQQERTILYRLFGRINWAVSAQPLADNSLLITDAEALSPPHEVPGARPRVGQSLFLKY